MSESFVDLSYRGLTLGKRIKLTQVRPQAGYLEMPTPMPVGSTIAISTDDGIQIEALVAEIHEQVGGSTQMPGMLVRPNFTSNENEKWWKARIDGAAVAADKAAQSEMGDKRAPAPDADGKVTLAGPRMTGQTAVPQVVDDGHITAVMDAVTDVPLEPSPGDSVDKVIADPDDPTANAPTRPSQRAIEVPDAPRTVAMDAVDLAALGLASPSGQMDAVKPEDYVDDGANTGQTQAAPEKPEGGKPKRKPRKKKGAPPT